MTKALRQPSTSRPLDSLHHGATHVLLEAPVNKLCRIIGEAYMRVNTPRCTRMRHLACSVNTSCL